MPPGSLLQDGFQLLLELLCVFHLIGSVIYGDPPCLRHINGPHHSVLIDHVNGQDLASAVFHSTIRKVGFQGPVIGIRLCQFHDLFFLVLCNVVVGFRVDIGLPVLDTKGVAVQEHGAIFRDAAR